METKINNDRYYRWSLISYASEEELKDLLDHSLHYAYIYHDRDNNESHFHILLTFKQQISLSRIKSYISSNQNTLGERLLNNFSMFEYLTHENLKKDEKAIYERDLIKCDNIDFWLSSTQSKEEENETFIVDLINLSPYEMARKYGRDYIRNYAKYQDFKNMLINPLGESDAI